MADNEIDGALGPDFAQALSRVLTDHQRGAVDRCTCGARPLVGTGFSDHQIDMLRPLIVAELLDAHTKGFRKGRVHGQHDITNRAITNFESTILGMSS